VGPAGAGAGDGEVDALEVEDHAEVHRHGGVHRLEDGPGPAQHRVLLLHDLGDGLVHRVGRAVIAIQEPHLVAVQVVLVNARVPQRVARCAVRILRRLRHIHPQGAGEFLLEVRHFHPGCQPRPKPHFLPHRIQNDPRRPFVQRLPHRPQVRPQARPDSQPCDDNSLHDFSFKRTKIRNFWGPEACCCVTNGRFWGGSSSKTLAFEDERLAFWCFVLK